MNYQAQWDFLKRKFESGNLSHAYLFSGQDEAGKKFFAKEFVKYIHCTHAAKIPCQHCANCAMIEKNGFADLMMVESGNSQSSLKNEKDMMEITVEQIRDAQHFLSYKSYYGNYKCLMVANAERMNREAQNCFLKNLEEPKGKTLIILLAATPEMLLPTIISRCQEVKFLSSFKQETSKEESLLQNILPIINAHLAEKFAYAKTVNLDGENFTTILTALQRYFRNVLLAHLGINSNLPETGKAFTATQAKKILTFIDYLRYQTNTTDANKKLALELLLLNLSS